MEYEMITVNEFSRNNLECVRKAKLFENGVLEYFPEPEIEEDEEDLQCMTTT